MKPNLHTRSAHPGDLPYVLATWVRSYASSRPRAQQSGAAARFRREYVDPVMYLDPHIIVLCSPESHRTLHGHVVALGDALCWLYVARDLRRQGYARELCMAALGGYPESVPVHRPWPFETKRFTFRKLEKAA